MHQGVLIHLFGMAAALFMAATPVMAAEAPAKDTVVIDLSGETSNCDPHLQWSVNSYAVYRNIFDNMLTRDQEGKVIPHIAVSWKQLADNKIEFKLRTDVKFHDGTPLTPEDVVYTIKRITSKELASPQRSQFEAVIAAEATAPDTVVFTTKAPYPALFSQLTKLSIVPKAYVEKVGSETFNLKPIGSGPYKFVSWDRGVSIKLERNDAYWGQKGFFPKAEFRFVPDAGTRVADLRTGKADLTVDMNSDLIASIKNDKVCEPRITLSERVAFVRTNNGHSPTDNRLIRFAMAYGIDKQGLIDGLNDGRDRLTHTLVVPEMAGYKPVQGLQYDPEKAKKLVAEAGAVAKEKMVFVTAPAFDQRVVQALQQMMNDLGMNVVIDMKDQTSFLKAMQQGELSTRPHLSLGTWSGGALDADAIAYPLLNSTSAWSQTRDPELDKVLEAARSCLDPEKRADLYAQASKIAIDNAYILPLFQMCALYAANKHLVWKPSIDENIFLNRMSWK